MKKWKNTVKLFTCELGFKKFNDVQFKFLNQKFHSASAPTCRELSWHTWITSWRVCCDWECACWACCACVGIICARWLTWQILGYRHSFVGFEILLGSRCWLGRKHKFRQKFLDLLRNKRQHNIQHTYTSLVREPIQVPLCTNNHAHLHCL